MKKIYLLYSSSYHLLNAELKKLIGDNQNVTYNSLSDMSIRDIIEDASYFGLFDEERVIVIKDTKFFGGNFKYEEDMESLLNFIPNLNDSTTLIFICDLLNDRKDNTKKMISLGAQTKSIVEDDKNIYETVEEYLKENDITIDKDTLNSIYVNCSKSLDTTLLEIEKLSNINKVITKSIIDEYGIKLTTIEDFAFSNAVIAKNFKVAFDELDKLLKENKSVPEIIGSIASKYIKMYAVRDAVARNLTDEEIVSSLGFKSTGQVYYAKKDSKIYTIDELREIIIKLVELDIKSKNGTDPIYALKEFLLSI